MASRWGIKAVGGSVAGAFGGLLGSALGNVPKSGMFERWRWIFLVEGLMTIIVSGLVYWYMPASAAEASFLTHAEKEVAIRRIDQENKMMVGGEDLGAWSLSVMKRALWNANTQLVSLAIMMTLLSMTALSLFMDQKLGLDELMLETNIKVILYGTITGAARGSVCIPSVAFIVSIQHLNIVEMSSS
ncbi:hypothetical protein MY8738_004420 [Beauveria namnaoensis]